MKTDVTISKYNGKEIMSCHLPWIALWNAWEGTVPSVGWLIQYTVQGKPRKLAFLCFKNEKEEAF